MALAGSTVFIAMKLQKIQRYGVQGFADFTTTGIDEKANRGHERRQSPHNCLRLTHRNRTRTLGVEHQTNGIRPGSYRGQGVLNTGNATNLAANGRHCADT